MVALLSIVIIFSIRSQKFQNLLADQLAVYFSAQWGMEVSIDHLFVNGFDYAEIQGLLIKDHHSDTLVYSPNLNASLASLSTGSRFAILSALNSEAPRIKIQKYEGEERFNLQMLIDKFKTEDTTSSHRFTLKINEVDLKDAHLTYFNHNVPVKNYGIDYEHIDLAHVNGKIIGMRSRGEVITLELKSVSLQERCGFILDDLYAQILVNPRKIKLEQLKFKTPYSEFQAKGVAFNYNSFHEFKDFVHKVEMTASIDRSIVDAHDLSFFVDGIEKFRHPIILEGMVKGTVSDLRLHRFFLGVTNQTYFDGDVHLSGLPDIKHTNFEVDLNVITSSASDIRSVDLKNFGLNYQIVLPELLDNLGTIYLMGTGSGSFKEFSVNVDVSSDIGVTTGEVSFNMDSLGKIYYEGNVHTSGLELGQFVKTKHLDKITSSLKFNGFGFTPKELTISLEAAISDFDLSGYQYDKINISGKIEHENFNGLVILDDKNLNVRAEGWIDYAKKSPVFDVKAEVKEARLSDMNWLSRPDAVVSFNVLAKGKGLGLDDFDGDLNLENIIYSENKTTYKFENIELVAGHAKLPNHEKIIDNSYGRKIKVVSEFAVVEMKGNFEFDSVPNSLYNLGARVLPSIFPKNKMVKLQKEEFDLNVDIGDLSQLSGLFLPTLKVAPKTQIHCEYTGSKDELEIAFKSDWITWDSIKMRNIMLDTTRRTVEKDSNYALNLFIDSIWIGSRFAITAFKIQGKAMADQLNTNITFAAADSSYWADIRTDGYVCSTTNFEFALHPSRFYSVETGLWHIDRDAHVIIDSTSVELDNLLAQNEFQSIRFDGKIADDPRAKLNFEIVDFDLQNVNNIFPDFAVELDGRLLLDGHLSNIYKKPYVDAYAIVQSLTINGYYTGDFELNTSWNPKFGRMEVTGALERPNGITDFSIKKGHYYLDKESVPANGSVMDFQFEFNKMDLAYINGLLPEGISDLEGKLDGMVALKGNPDEPKFKGYLYLNNTALNIDLLNVRYDLKGRIDIEPDMIALNGLPLKDKYGAQGILVGSFFHQNFKNYNFEFFSTFNKPFLVMNTSYLDNPLYYGDAFVTGTATVSYDKYNEMEINVDVKSEKGTHITLPLYGSEDVVLQDFITFVSDQEESVDYEVDLTGITMNFAMDITDDAEIELVFDEVVGDEMKGRGNGHIDMYIDQFSDFYMFGNYEITEGSYLFTLKDFINKKFLVKPGSEISWYGDPYDAIIDIKAFYPLKASLYDIMPENEKEKYKQKSEVECMMMLSQNLFNPNIAFDIQLPRSDENAKTVLSNMVSTEQEMNKQVFSLLILNKFLPRSDGYSESSNLGFMEASTSEVLSNQLSNMISNFSDDFELGFNYSPGDNISNDELAVAMSTQLFNDRMTINTNVGVSQGNSTNNNPNSFIGDVDVEYKINPPRGNFRVHGFNESNEADITKSDQAKYTQGVGAMYHESFDNLGELWCNFSNLFKPSAKRKVCE